MADFNKLRYRNVKERDDASAVPSRRGEERIMFVKTKRSAADDICTCLSAPVAQLDDDTG